MCGAVNRTRKGLPSFAAAEVKQMKRGDVMQQQHGNMSCLVFMDEKALWLLYNHISPLLPPVQIERWGAHGEQLLLACPQAVRDYFKEARAVDVAGQLHYAYLLGRKSKRPCSRLVWWLVDICITNAYKLRNFRGAAPTQLEFRLQLMEQLAAPHRAAGLGSSSSSSQSSVGPAAAALARDHYSVHADAQRDCEWCKHTGGKRVRPSYQCKTCRVNLCIGDCFGQYHAHLDKGTLPPDG